MDPKANIAQQIAAARAILALQDGANDDGTLPAGARDELERLAFELAELVTALEDWRRRYPPAPARPAWLYLTEGTVR